MAPVLSQSSNLKEEENLQAVLLSENFTESFEPLTKDTHLVLIPLVNTPLLDYSLDWLQRCDVNETIIYCCAQSHSEKIKDHCKRWRSSPRNQMEVRVIVSENCSSLGDAMRDLYSKSLLKGDFLLLSGDVIGNLELKSIWKKHKDMRQKDRSAVMTCVYTQQKWTDDKTCLDSSRVVNLVTSSGNNKILMHFRPSQSKVFAIPTDVIQNFPHQKIHKEIQDPNIAICSDVIPSLFSDNFDYGTRDSLVQGVIEQEELMGYTICAYIAPDGYAARISSFKSYQEISEAVIKRINFPSVPERSLSSQRIRYNFEPFSSTYWDNSAKFQKKSIGDDVVIDAGSEIDRSSTVVNSVIGKHCIIKENVHIQNSFIMSNVIINNGCRINQSFVGNDVILLQNVSLEPGVVVGDCVVLGPDLNVERSARFSSVPPVDEFTGTSSKQDIDQAVCGKGGKAYIYCPDEDENTVIWGKEYSDLSDVDESDSCSEDSDNEFDNQEEDAMMSDEEREHEFIKEVNDSIVNAYREKSAADNVVLEINASRHAYNVTMEDVLLAVTAGIIRVEELDTKIVLKDEELKLSILRGMKYFENVLKNYIKKPRDQMIMLKAIETLCENARYLPIIQKILLEINQELDILDDEIIIVWFDRGGHSTQTFPALSKAINKFVDWLRESSEEESDE